MSDLPRRRLVLNLSLQADDLAELGQALRTLGNDLEWENLEEREITSGGYSSGFHLTLTCDQEMTGDRYRKLLMERFADR